jgi:hydroxymethylbilane synthase
LRQTIYQRKRKNVGKLAGEMVRVGTRGSQLARTQTGHVIDQLRSFGFEVQEVIISTRGDQQQTVPIAQIGNDGVFVRELEKALLEERIDLAVHSLKDLPTAMTPGLEFACTPPRATPFDVLVSRDGVGLRDLPADARVGTASIRRRIQLRAVRPDLQIVAIRGNVDSRLKRVDERELDAVVLAAAGLERLGRADCITESLQPPEFWPAVAQGALVIQIKEANQRVREILEPIHDSATYLATVAERVLLATLAGGCLAPIGSWGRFEADGELSLGGCVLSDAGGNVEIRTASCSSHVRNSESAASLGREVAEKLLSEGAQELLDLMRDGGEPPH